MLITDIKVDPTNPNVIRMRKYQEGGAEKYLLKSNVFTWVQSMLDKKTDPSEVIKLVGASLNVACPDELVKQGILGRVWQFMEGQEGGEE